MTLNKNSNFYVSFCTFEVENSKYQLRSYFNKCTKTFENSYSWRNYFFISKNIYSM